MRRVLIGFAVIGLVAIGGYLWFTGTETEASAPITAPAVEPVDASARTFDIDAASSQARFVIDEVLRGEPKTVVGSTDQIAGEASIDLGDPSTTRIGVIRINARTFATDEARRNTAIRRFILSTDQFEFIEFTPVQIVGLPSRIEGGEALSFAVTGDLKIRDVVQSVTFDVVATVTEGRIEGSAQTMVLRSDFGISIPSVPFVADVSDEVRLELDFVATSG